MKPKYRIVRGMRMPMGFPPEGLESGMAYVPLDSDIFVASYPKSGTTWLQYIVYLLLERPPLGAGESLSRQFPHLEEVGASVVEALPSPRLIKTHLPRDLSPFSASVPYIVICRNPFDCAVSFFHHTRGFPRHYDFSEGSFDDFFRCFIDGETDFGDYFDHLISWQSEPRRENILFLTYESLKRDTRLVIECIANFLRERSAASIAPDNALEAIIEESSLVSMRRNQQRWASKRPDCAPGFVRKGEIGDWRSLFTRDQVRGLLTKFDRRLTNAGIGNLWPDEIAAAREFAESNA